MPSGPAKRNKNIGLRSMPCAIRALEGDGRRFEVSFSSEEPYQRYFGPEILDHSAGSVDLSRLQEIGVVLFNHDRDAVIGKIERAWIEGARGKAIIAIDDDDESERIRRKMESGTLKGTSVGYRVFNWEEVEAGSISEDGRFQGPCSIARKWEPYEISVVSVPADPTVGVGRDFYDDYPPQPGPDRGNGLTVALCESIIRNNTNTTI